MFSLAKGLMTDSREVEGGRCMRRSDEKLCFSDKVKSGLIIWKGPWMKKLLGS